MCVHARVCMEGSLWQGGEGKVRESAKKNFPDEILNWILEDTYVLVF